MAHRARHVHVDDLSGGGPLLGHVGVPLLFFFNDPPTPEIYTLSLHDALPILRCRRARRRRAARAPPACRAPRPRPRATARSEEHTSELQSRSDLVCRLLLEKKKKNLNIPTKQHNTRT